MKLINTVVVAEELADLVKAAVDTSAYDALITSLPKLGSAPIAQMWRKVTCDDGEKIKAVKTQIKAAAKRASVSIKIVQKDASHQFCYVMVIAPPKKRAPRGSKNGAVVNIAADKAA